MDGDVWDLYDHTRVGAEGCTPIGVVLTMAAAGSEMSDSSVITKRRAASSAAITTISAARSSPS